MLTLIFWLVVLGASIFAMTKASEYFTDAAERIGLKLGLPAFIVGVIIISVGTSLPELVSSIYSVYIGASEIVIGNVVGSNITNIFLVLGITAIMAKRIHIGFEISIVDLPIMIGSAFIVWLMASDGMITFMEGVLCLLGFVVYIFYTKASQKKDIEFNKEVKSELKTKKVNKSTWLELIIGAVIIYIGAQFTVESILKLSAMINIGTDIIAVTAVALGTSLPELIVSITALKHNEPELAVGNLLGSNIFNSFAVVGIPALMGDLIVTPQIISFALPLMIIASVLFLVMTQDKQMTQWEGWILLIFYAFFLGKTFGVV